MRLDFQVKVLANGLVFIHQGDALFIIFLTRKMTGKAGGSNDKVIRIFLGNIRKRDSRFEIETMQMTQRGQAVDGLTAKFVAGNQDKMPVFVIGVFYSPIGTLISLDAVKQFYIGVFILQFRIIRPAGYLAMLGNSKGF